MADSVIRELVESWAPAIRARDLDALMSVYARDTVSFDLGPPLRYCAADNKRHAWEEFLAALKGDIGYEVHELRVGMDGDVAFAHSLNHVTGTLANGQTSALWVRWTACLRRLDGAWSIVHDHVSVPADLAHGKAVLNLTP